MDQNQIKWTLKISLRRDSSHKLCSHSQSSIHMSSIKEINDQVQQKRDKSKITLREFGNQVKEIALKQKDGKQLKKNC